MITIVRKTILSLSSVALVASCSPQGLSSVTDNELLNESSKTAAATVASTPIHSGRAISVTGRISTYSNADSGTYSKADTLNDTGSLAASGGFIQRILAVGSLFYGNLTTGDLSAITQGNTFDQSRSNSAVANLNFSIEGNLITAALIPSSSQCTCPNGSTVPVCQGGIFIDSLRLNGSLLATSGDPAFINQTFNIPSGGQIIANEQVLTGSGNSANLKVVGVHVIIPGKADMVFSLSEAGITCR